MAKIVITLNMQDAPQSILNMIKPAMEKLFKAEMEKNGIPPENVSVEIEE